LLSREKWFASRMIGFSYFGCRPCHASPDPAISVGEALASRSERARTGRRALPLAIAMGPCALVVASSVLRALPGRRHRWSGREELGHGPRDGLGLLDRQQVTGAVDRAFVDVGQRQAEDLGDLLPYGLRSLPSIDRTGWWMAAAGSAPNAHSVSAGSSTPMNVSASPMACSSAPGTRGSSGALAFAHSRPLTALVKSPAHRRVTARVRRERRR
jgi:hypothetical protein